MPNTPPTLVGLSSSLVFGENAVNAAPALIDGDVTFGDTDANFAGAEISLTGLLAEDRVSIRNQGFGAGQIGLFGVNVTYGGVAIGTFSGGVGGTLTISLNSSATSVAVDALLQNLTYANVSDSPTASRTLTLQIEDGAGAPMVRPAEYAALTGAANPFNGLDLGQQGAPAFVDIDFDGDLDLVAGDRNGQIRVLRKDGASYSELIGAANPFNGVDTVEYSRPAFLDLDGDGDMDAVIGTSGGLLRSWRNVGGVFTELTGADNPFNGVDVGEIAAPAFVDIDNDGDLDAVVGELFGTLKLFVNSGGTFTAAIGAANPLNGVDVGFFSSPGFIDIDGDGDMDLVVGSNTNSLAVLRNEGGVFSGLPFAENPFAPFGIASYATPAFVDLDGDGDLDAVFGQNNGLFRVFQNTAPLGRTIEISVTEESDVPTLADVAPSLALLENVANAGPVLIDADVTFAAGSSGLAGGKLIVSGLLPEDRLSIVAGGHISVSGATISYDGTLIGSVSGGQGNSLIVTFTAAAGAAEVEALIERLGYSNVSQTPTADRILHFNVVDSVGGALDGPLSLTPFPVDPFPSIPGNISNAAPAFTDLDGDGDADLVLGDLYGLLRAYRNAGGTFVELTGAANPFSAIDVFFNSMPSFVDLDGDGDKDMILGEDNVPGALRTYRNDAGSYVQLTGAADPFAGIAFGRATAPAPADVDGDGDIDLIVGLLDGHMRYFENDGTGLVERTGANNPFDSIVVGGYGSPAWIDVDGDGDLDLAIGSNAGVNGSLRTWRNDGGTFTELTGAANPFAVIDLSDRFGVRPSFADIDGDGDLDTVLGMAIGGVWSYRNDASFGPSIAVHVTAEDDIPSLSGLASSAGFAENAINAAPSVLDSDVTFGAGSAGMNGGSLTVSGLLAEDRLSIRTEGPISVSSATISYLGTPIGSVSGGEGADLVVTFTAAANSAAIEALLERLAYANVSDTPVAARTLTFAVVDGAGGSLSGGAATLTVNVGAENDAPTLADLSASVTFAENDANAAPRLIDTDVSFGDPEGNVAGGTLTVTGLLAEDRIAIRDQGLGSGTIALFGSNVIYNGIAIGTFSGGAGATFTVSFNSAATAAAVDALIQNLTYANTSDLPTAGRTLTLSVSDALGAAVSSAVSIAVTAENDAPVLTVPGAQDGTEDSNLIFSAAGGNAIAVSDPDASTLEVTLSVGPGVLTLAGTSGLSFSVGDGTGDTTMTFSGTAAAINSALDGLVYRGNLNHQGSDTLTVTTSDLGETGSGGTRNDLDTIAITLADDGLIDGDGGNNVLDGTPAADQFRLQQGGDDNATGQASGDHFYFGAAFTAADTVDGQSGGDIISLQGDYSAGVTFGTGLASNITSIESISLLPGNLTAFGDVSGAFYSYNLTMLDSNVAAGTELKINGHHLRVGENVIFDGGAETNGSFRICAGLGVDMLTGGGKGDLFIFGHDGRFGSGDIISGGAGNDVLYLRGDYTIDFNAVGFAGSLVSIESVGLVSTSDSSLIIGGDGEFDYAIVWNDTMLATGATITFNGSKLLATETITFDGSSEAGGNLRLWGGAAADTLTTGGGNDLLYGGLGADALTGNGGADTYRYQNVLESASGSVDTISGFAHGLDKIDLSSIDAKSGTAANDAFSFIGAAAFSGVAGQLRAVQTDALTNSWAVQADTNGDSNADLVINVIVNPLQSLNGADFYF